MPRTARSGAGGILYHVLNRGNGRMRIFRKTGDYLAFIKLLIEARSRAEIEIFSFCLMPNHWHLVLRPAGDRDLARFMSWLTNTHVKRYRAHYRNTSGHLYQGRFKSFPIEEDEHLLIVLRYVEANALRARLVDRAEHWLHSSIGCGREVAEAILSDWPVDRPRNWRKIVNQHMPEASCEQVRTSVKRGRPFGSDAWIKRTAKQLGLEQTIRAPGRPRKTK